MNAESTEPRTLTWVEVWFALLALAACASALGQMARGGAGEGMFLPAVAILVCLLAAGFDAAIARIPNPISYTAAFIGIAVNCIYTLAILGGQNTLAHWLGGVPITQSLIGLGVCTAIAFSCLLVPGNQMGGGDAKLLMAMGAIIGWSNLWPSLLVGLAIAVIYSLVNLIILGRLNAVMKWLAMQILEIVYLKQVDPETAPTKTWFPLAVPLAAGLLLARFVNVRHWLGVP